MIDANLNRASEALRVLEDAARFALEDGATRPAELGDVTHVRWTIARLAPGEQGSLSYFAVIR